MYWRYSANSTLKPLNGLRWRPDRKPSTIVRALSSSVPRRATTAGSRNGRSRTMGIMSGLHAALGYRDGIDQPLDHRVRGDALRFGVEVRHHTVAQDRLGERLNVLDRHVIAAVHERARLRAAHERLRRAQAGAPLHPFLDEFRRVHTARARGAHQAGGIARDLLGDHHLAGVPTEREQ